MRLIDTVRCRDTPKIRPTKKIIWKEHKLNTPTEGVRECCMELHLSQGHSHVLVLLEMGSITNITNCADHSGISLG